MSKEGRCPRDDPPVRRVSKQICKMCSEKHDHKWSWTTDFGYHYNETVSCPPELCEDENDRLHHTWERAPDHCPYKEEQNFFADNGGKEHLFYGF